MKKILSIMLCAVMLLGTMMSVVTAADVPENGWELAEYGQQTIYTGAPVDAVDAPIVDGEIKDGEYTTALEPFIKGEINEGWWTGGNDCDNIEIFTCLDDEYLYIALRFTNETIISNEEKIVWNDNSERIAIKLSPDATNMQPFDKCDSAFDYEPDGSKHQSWGKFDSVVVNIVDKVVTFECAYEIIDLLDNWGLDEIERLYFVAIISSANSDTPGDGNETWFSFSTKNGDVLAKYPPMNVNLGLMPHVLVLSADPDSVPAETEPTETEPTETEPTETEPTEVEPTETEPTETEPTATEPTETEPTATEPTDTTDTADDDAKEGGCGSSIAAMGIALVATLGTAVTVVAKKKD